MTFSGVGTSQKRMERLVRSILRRARNAAQLSQVPLVRELCFAMDISNPVAMVRKIVESTFGDGPGQKTLLRLIVDCDLDGTLTQAGAAESLNLSRRQFHRLRSQAIGTIAVHVERTLGYPISGETRHPFETLAQSIMATKPGAAAMIYSLLGDSTAIDARLLELRARVDSGEMLAREIAMKLPASGRAAALALVAQSQHINGAPHASVQSILSELSELWDRTKGAFDNATRFELEYLNFLQQRARANAYGMRSSAQNLERLAELRPAWQTRALLAKAEAAWRCGDETDAQKLIAALHNQAAQGRNVRLLANANLLDAGVLFLQQQYQRAELSAQAAALALEDYRPDGIAAERALGRIRLMTGVPWSPKKWLEDTDGVSYEHVSFRLVYARSLIAGGHFLHARRAATEALERATQCELAALVAYANVTLAVALDHLGESERAQHHYCVALTEFISIHDRLAAFDLFMSPRTPQRGFGPIKDIEQVVDVVLNRLQVAVRNLYFSTDDLPYCRHLVRAVLAARGSDGSILSDELLRSCPKHLSDAIIRDENIVEDAFYFGAAIILPATERDDFMRCVRSALRSIHRHPAERLSARGA